MEEEIAKVILWRAQERMKTEPFQNINSAIHAVKLEVTLYLMAEMAKHKGETK